MSDKRAIDSDWVDKFGRQLLGFAARILNGNATFCPAEKLESPIETKFFFALFCVSRFSANNLVVCDSHEFGELSEKYSLVIAMQFKWRNYRSDFCIGGSKFDPILIECDGHDFHENKQQAARDKQRDAEAQIDGLSIIRFTGSQIHNSPMECVQRLYALIASKKRARQKSGLADALV